MLLTGWLLGGAAEGTGPWAAAQAGALWALAGGAPTAGSTAGVDALAVDGVEPGPASPGTKGNIAFRLLDLESRVATVTGAMRRELGEVLDEAVVEVARVDRARAGRGGSAARPRRRDRARVLEMLAAIDVVLVRRGFVHPAGGAVGLLSEALTPFHMGDGERGAVEARAENARRRDMIAARFPGPFHAIDCDTAASLYMGVGERLGWPLHMVLVPSRNRQRSHVFVRWREGARRIDWETTEGRERVGDGIGDGGGRREGAVWAGPEVEVEVGIAEVPGCGHYLVAVQLERRGEGVAGLRVFAEALAVFPGHLDARRQLAWNLATLPDLPGRDVGAAVAHAREVVRRCGDADARDTLAAAYAASGRFDLAVREEKAAIADSEASDMARAGYRFRLGLYQRSEVYRQPGR